MAQTLPRFVRQSPSTATKPRSSRPRPTVAAPRPAVCGTRPIETISRSNVVALRLAFGVGVADHDLVGRYVDTGDRDAGVDREALLREHPLRFLRDRLVRGAEGARAALPAPSSARPAVATRCPSRSPITPAPTTPSRFGTSVMASAPALSSTRTLSNATPGSARGVGAGRDDHVRRGELGGGFERHRRP